MKLAEFGEQLDTTENASNNILNNLCTGLEAFLGFDPSSKGYDGTGIVYSDLDRLCDAVMGFLKGVLGAVKDDDAVTTYDKNKDSDINTVITTLTSKIGSGRTGLAESVGAVKAWLEGYNEEVGKRTKAVKTPLEDLLKEDDDKRIPKLLVAIKKMQNKAYEDVATKNSGELFTWIDSVAGLLEITEEASNALTNIDKPLRNIVKPHVDLINQAVSDFVASSKNEHNALLAVASDAHSALKQLERDVKEKATNARDECISALNEEFREHIQDPLNKLNTALTQVHKDLQVWITRAKQIASNGIAQANRILKEVDENSEGKKSGNWKRVVDAATLLKNKGDTLFMAASESQKHVDELVPAALDVLRNMNWRLKQDLWKIKDAVNTQVEKIKLAIKHVYNNVTGKRAVAEEEKTVENFMRHIITEVEFIKTKVGHEKDANKNDPFSVDHIWDKLRGEIANHVAKIKGEQGNDIARNNKGIQHIVKGVMQWADKFTKDAGDDFEDEIVQGWVDNMVKNEPVRSLIREYVDVNRGLGYFDGQLRAHGTDKLLDPVIEIIIEKVKNEIKKMKPSIRPGERRDVENILKDIQQYLSEISGKINDKESDIIQAFTESAKRNPALRSAGSSGSHRPSYLKSAVAAILTALSTTAKQVTAELNEFTEESRINLGANLTHILGKAEAIGEQIATAGGSYGAKIQLALDSVKPRIQMLHHNIDQALQVGAVASTHPSNAKSVDNAINGLQAELNKQMPWDTKNTSGFPLTGSGEVTIDKNIFRNYNSYVEQGNMQPAKQTGRLPEAISIIKTKVKDALMSISTLNAESQEQLKQVESLLSKLMFTIKELIDKESADPKGVKNYFEELQTMLTENGPESSDSDRTGTFLENIQTRLNNVIGTEGEDNGNRDTLLGIINAGEHFFRMTIEDKVKECIMSTTSKLADQAKTKIKSIQKESLRQYAISRDSELQKLKQLVEREKNEIEKIIAADLKSGLKGMMGKMKANETFLDTLQKQTEFRTATPQVRMYLEELLTYVEDQVKIPRPQQPKKDTAASTKIANVKTMLGLLLDDLSSSNHFDHTFSSNLADFTDSLSALQPFKFTGHNHPELPDAMKGGLRKLVGELGRAYVNVYSGQKIDWEKSERAKRNCAKACITISHTLFHELYCLFYHGATKWKSFDFTGSATKEDNKHALQEYLEGQGYNVDNLINKQNSGWDVALTLRKSFKDKYEFHTPPDKSHTNFNLYLASIDRANGFVAQLFDYVERYYKLCHISDSSAGTQPCSVYHMLIWLNGLPHRSVYDKLNFDYFSELFEKPDSADTEGIDLEGLSLSDLNAETLAAYPHDVTVTNLTNALTDVCSQSYYLLTSFLGHGHANGVYACDYSNNAFNLSYPSSPGACFEMLVDFVNRLYRQLFFLYTQCSNDENCSGWRNCWYGQQVGGSAWNCNTMQCPNQKGNQNHKQTCNQKCDQTAECGIKSPLQSFLEDGLPGFLPHSFSKPGCKLTCTVSNHRGLPCITPMGFADLSVAASCTQQGVHLKNILKDFCGTKAAPLTHLCAQLTCLLQKPPQTLGDIFAFYYSYLEEWADGFYGKPPKTTPYTKAAFNDAVTEANFREQYSGFNPSILVSTSKHGEEHSKGNLCSIANCKSGSAVPCGLYVKSVTQEISMYYSSEHKANHLSWIVYITETFYDLLKKLYDDCCNKCGPTGSKCYTKSCDEKCSVKYTTDKTEQVSAVSTEHQPTCKSIVTCPDTHPTLYKYGFTFGNAITLNGSRGNTGAKRTCKDFCEALKKMLGDGCVLIELRKQIDAFLWAIRTPFTYLVLALWSLSLFYLICVMVGRLDVLHIRSHLRTPSSHKITAQSLLAAAQVGRLSKISYLQP